MRPIAAVDPNRERGGCETDWWVWRRTAGVIGVRGADVTTILRLSEGVCECDRGFVGDDEGRRSAFARSEDEGRESDRSALGPPDVVLRMAAPPSPAALLWFWSSGPKLDAAVE